MPKKKSILPDLIARSQAVPLSRVFTPEFVEWVIGLPPEKAAVFELSAGAGKLGVSVKIKDVEKPSIDDVA